MTVLSPWVNSRTRTCKRDEGRGWCGSNTIADI